MLRIYLWTRDLQYYYWKPFGGITTKYLLHHIFQLGELSSGVKTWEPEKQNCLLVQRFTVIVSLGGQVEDVPPVNIQAHLDCGFICCCILHFSGCVLSFQGDMVPSSLMRIVRKLNGECWVPSEFLCFAVPHSLTLGHQILICTIYFVSFFLHFSSYALLHTFISKHGCTPLQCLYEGCLQSSQQPALSAKHTSL
jgi:hypothetical protein